MEEYDEDVDMDADGFEEGESDDFDADALSYDDDEIEGDNDGLVEEHPFEHDAPPQAVLNIGVFVDDLIFPFLVGPS